MRLEQLEQLAGRWLRRLATNLLWLQIRWRLERLFLPYLLGLDTVVANHRLSKDTVAYIGKLRDYLVFGIVYRF